MRTNVVDLGLDGGLELLDGADKGGDDDHVALLNGGGSGSGEGEGSPGENGGELHCGGVDLRR